MNKTFKSSIFVIIFTLLLFPGSGLTTDRFSESYVDSSSFNALSQDLMEMMSTPRLFELPSDQKAKYQHVIFHSSHARRIGFSPESIALAEELTDFTNELITLSPNGNIKTKEKVDVTKIEIDTEKYPAVSAFFEAAVDYVVYTDFQATEDTKEIGSLCFLCSTSPACTCGSWWWPRPSSAAPWQTHNVTNPESTLRSWGYHETPGFAGGGWTRPQTYKWWMCGWNTYRDHAYISNGQIREQNYAGYTPRGEPNPEVWRSGPWPYALWPTYVRWWHDNF